jgi:hypothetical protein
VSARPIVAVWATATVLVMPFLLFDVDDIIAMCARAVVAVRATSAVLIVSLLFLGLNDRRASIIDVGTGSIIAVGGGGISTMPPFLDYNVCDFWDS